MIEHIIVLAIKKILVFIIQFIIYLRHIRILGMSSFELILTSTIIAYTIKFPKNNNFNQNLIFLLKKMIMILFLAIIVHWLFGINTQLNYWLNLSKCPPNFDSLLGRFKC